MARPAALWMAATWVFAALGLVSSAHPAVAVPLSDVDPFIGTAADGNTVPGPQVPFGFANPSPDMADCPTPSGYCPGSPALGFSQTHVSGTGGAGKYGNVRLTPYVGEWTLRPAPAPLVGETARPGYYAATLAGVRTELTASRLATLTRIVYPRRERAWLLVDAAARLPYDGPQAQRAVRTIVRINSPRSFSGSITVAGGWGDGRYTLHFAAEFDRPVVSLTLWRDGIALPGRRALVTRAERAGVLAGFDARKRRAVRVRVGLSFRSVKRARANLRSLPGFSFAAQRRRAERAWRQALGRVDVDGGTPAQRRVFATALYRAHLMPHDLSGENAWWRSSAPHYEDFYTLWDTFRTQAPLLTLIQPKRQADMVASLLDTYRHTGWLPDGRIAGNNGLTQVGSSATVVIADALDKQMRVDRKLAYRALRKDADVDSPRWGHQGRRLSAYLRLGYVPADERASVSRTVEYAYNDYAASRAAATVGDRERERRYLERSRSWRNLWDPETLSLRPRHRDGSFVADFDAFRRWWGWDAPVYEGSARAYSTFVPHDVGTLIRLVGGEGAFVAWLDETMQRAHDPSNEPSLLAPWLYVHAGRHDRTVEHVRRLLAEAYSDAPAGLPGNDDAGTLSAWYAWAAIGLYPNAGQPWYYIGSPIFDRVRIQLPRKRTLTIAADGSGGRPYVASATLNGRPLKRAWLTHRELVHGGELHLTMSSTPTGFGSTQPPPSPASGH